MQSVMIMGPSYANSEAGGQHGGGNTEAGNTEGGQHGGGQRVAAGGSLEPSG